MSPLSAVNKLRGISPVRDRVRKERPSSAGPSISVAKESHTHNDEECSQKSGFKAFQSSTRTPQRSRTPITIDLSKRDKSPKSMLREAKEKLRNKDSIKDTPPTPSREKSPSAVLREAKLRLRKLEIEAEAVEKSYLDFRKRQTALREERTERLAMDEPIISRDAKSLDVRRSRSLQDLEESSRATATNPPNIDTRAMKRDFDKYLREYAPKIDLERFKNKNTVLSKVKPIPQSYSNVSTEEIKDNQSENYLETPLAEFRKLYHAQKPTRPFRVIDAIQDSLTRPLEQNITEHVADNVENEGQKDLEAIKDALIKKKRNKKKELEILKRNINKMYNFEESPATDIQHSKEVLKQDEDSDRNLLRIEIETVSEANNLKLTESEEQDVILVVQSSIEAREIEQTDSEDDGLQISTNMTILISPKRSTPEAGDEIDFDRPRSPKSKRSVSPEQAARLTRNDVLDAIFHTDTIKETSSFDMAPDPETSKEGIEDSISEVEKDVPYDYPDDFSADVDNYNSRSEYENNSPISLPKTDDGNFWDS